MKPGQQPSRGAFRLLDRLNWYQQKYGHVHPKQEKLGKGLHPPRTVKGHVVNGDVCDSMVRRYLRELKSACTHHCPAQCDGGVLHVGLVKVHQGGNGRTASYTVKSRAEYRAESRAEYQAELSVASRQETANAKVADQKYRAETAPVVCSSCSSRSSEAEQHHSPVSGSSPAANDVVPEKPSPEGKAQNQEAIAEVWAVVKSRTVVAPSLVLTKANKAAIREMLDHDQSVDFAKQLVFRGSLRKLATWVNRGEESPIVSLRYFLAPGLVEEVKRDIGELSTISKPAYWQFVKQSLLRLERKWESGTRSFPGSAARTFEERDVA